MTKTYTRFKSKPECGTKAGYDYHRRGLLQEPCESCREAMKNYWRDYRKQTKRVRKFPDAYKIAVREWAKLKKRGIDKLVLETYNDICYLCHKQIDLTAPRLVGVPGWENGLHIDHVIPLSKNGTSDMSNLRPTHAYCNQKKAAKVNND